MWISPRSIVFLLASAPTVFSTGNPLSPDLASNFPNCAQSCINDGIQQYCAYDQTDVCVCWNQAYQIFSYLYSCSASSAAGCSNSEVESAVYTGYSLCYGAGYDILQAPSFNTGTGTGSDSTTIPGGYFTSVPSGTLSPTSYVNIDGTTSPTATGGSGGGSKKLSTGALVGIIIGGLAVLILVIGLIAFLLIRKRKPASQPPPAAVAPLPAYPPAAPPPQAYPQYSYPSPPPQAPSQPLMKSYELEQPAGYYAPPKNAEAGYRPGAEEEQKQYIQELPSDTVSSK